MSRPHNDPDHDDSSDETHKGSDDTHKSDEMADADTANGEGDPTTPGASDRR